MSKEFGSEKCLDTSNSIEAWNTAISDAEQMIAEAKKAIADLRQSIKTFQRLRDKGMSFPGAHQK